MFVRHSFNFMLFNRLTWPNYSRISLFSLELALFNFRLVKHDCMLPYSYKYLEFRLLAYLSFEIVQYVGIDSIRFAWYIWKSIRLIRWLIRFDDSMIRFDWWNRTEGHGTARHVCWLSSSVLLISSYHSCSLLYRIRDVVNIFIQSVQCAMISYLFGAK